MLRKLEDDIACHRAQIERLHQAIALGEPAKVTAVKTPSRGRSAAGGVARPPR